MLPDLGHSRSVGVANIISPTRDVYGTEFFHDGTFSIVLTGDRRMYVHPRCGSLKLNLMSLELMSAAGYSVGDDESAIFVSTGGSAEQHYRFLRYLFPALTIVIVEVFVKMHFSMRHAVTAMRMRSYRRECWISGDD